MRRVKIDPGKRRLSHRMKMGSNPSFEPNIPGKPLAAGQLKRPFREMTGGGGSYDARD